MKDEIVRTLPHLHRIAEHRAAGLSWPQIAGKLQIDEDSIRLRVILHPHWERLLADARREFAAELATQAMIALGSQLQSDDAKVRMNAAIPLLRLHQTNLRNAAKANKEDFPPADMFAERPPSENSDGKYPPREDNCRENAVEESRSRENPPRADSPPEGLPQSRPASKSDSGGTSIPIPPSHSPRGGKIDLRRNMLLAPLISSKKPDRPPDGKRR